MIYLLNVYAMVFALKHEIQRNLRLDVKELILHFPRYVPLHQLKSHLDISRCAFKSHIKAQCHKGRNSVRRHARETHELDNIFRAMNLAAFTEMQRWNYFRTCMIIRIILFEPTLQSKEKQTLPVSAFAFVQGPLGHP